MLHEKLNECIPIHATSVNTNSHDPNFLNLMNVKTKKVHVHVGLGFVRSRYTQR